MKKLNLNFKRFFNSRSLQNWKRKLTKFDLKVPASLKRLSNHKAVRQFTNSPTFRKLQQNKVVWMAGAAAFVAFIAIGTIRLVSGVGQPADVAAVPAEQTPPAQVATSESGTQIASPVEVAETSQPAAVQAPASSVPPAKKAEDVPAVVAARTPAGTTQVTQKVASSLAPPQPSSTAAPRAAQVSQTVPALQVASTPQSVNPPRTVSAPQAVTTPPAAPSQPVAVNAPSTRTKQVSITKTEELPFEIIEMEENPAPPATTTASDPNALEIIDLSGTSSSKTKEPKAATPVPPVDPAQAKALAAEEARKVRKFNRIEATLKKHPDQESKARKYGKLLTQLGEYERGERFYLWYLKSHPHDGKAFYGLGCHYQASRKWENACKAYQRAADLDADDEMARNNLAWVLATCPDASVRDGARAVKAAKEANALLEWPKPSIAITMAAAFAEAGDFRAAIRIQKWAIRSAPKEERLAMVKQLEMYRRKEAYRMP